MKKINLIILALNFKFCLNPIPNSKDKDDFRFSYFLNDYANSNFEFNAPSSSNPSHQNLPHNEYLNQLNSNRNHITQSNYDPSQHFNLGLSNSNSRYQIYNAPNLFNSISIRSNSIPDHGINPDLQSNLNQEFNPQNDPSFNLLQNYLTRSSGYPLDFSHYFNTSPDIILSNPRDPFPPPSPERGNSPNRLSDDPNLLHSSSSSQVHDSVPKQKVVTSADSNRPSTLPQESNSLVLHSNPPDLSEFTLAPFYFVASLHFPYYQTSKQANQIRQVVEDAILQSSFNNKLAFKFHQVNLSRSFPERSLPTFLLNLCLQNLAFLLALNSQAHDQVLDELKLTLNWLYNQIKQPNGSIIQAFDFSSTDSSNLTKFPNSNIAKTLYDFLQSKTTDNKSLSIFLRLNRDKGTQMINRIEAQGARTTLTLLSHYYKSINLKKWESLFPDDALFLKLYLRLAQAGFNRHVPKYLTTIHEVVQPMNVLPWSNSALIEEVDLRKIFGQLTINDMLKNRIPGGLSRVETEELNRLELRCSNSLRPFMESKQHPMLPLVIKSDLLSISSVPAKQGRKHDTFDLQAIDLTERNINPFDMTQVPLLPFYVMAGLNYPLSSSDANNNKVSRTIENAILGSSMKLKFFESGIPRPDLLSLKNRLIYETSRDVTSKQGFIIRLCLKNLIFIRSIGSNSRLDEVETQTMLTWLNSILDPPIDPDPPNEIQSSVLKLVQEHLSSVNLGKLHVHVRKSNSKKRSKSTAGSGRLYQKVTEFQAQDAKVILNVLGNYYKSQNILKWRSFFKRDRYFLEYYINLAGEESESGPSGSLSERFSKNNEKEEYLPWKENRAIKNLPDLFVTSYTRLFSSLVQPLLHDDVLLSQPWRQLKLYEGNLESKS